MKTTAAAALFAAIIATGCAHQGGSARYEEGSDASVTVRSEQPAWRDMDVDWSSDYADPTARDYLNAGGHSTVETGPSVAIQMDPAAAIHSQDMDASEQAKTSVDVRTQTASTLSPARTIDSAVSLETQSPTGVETVVTTETEPTQDGVVATQSADLPGAEARSEDIPAAVAGLKDNHPDLTDDPDYQQSAVGGAASAESGSASSSDNTTVPAEKNVIAPLSGVPSDGSSGQLNSSSSIERNSLENNSVSSNGQIQLNDRENISVEVIPGNVGTSSGTESGEATSMDRTMSDRIYRELHGEETAASADSGLRDVKITARGGVVMLNGSVGSQSAKDMIEERVFKMEGVKSVQNNLTIHHDTENVKE